MSDVQHKRLKFRAWHRGTREADYLVGGFFDSYGTTWSAADIAWFERLLDQEDVDILAWAMGQAAPPADFAGPMMTAMQRLDYIRIL
ncbi:MAG: hypothetical protein RLZZ58_1579 [Pseudomonadota bacterium]|jgi:antitoxin CptB